MNERIRELAGKALDRAVPETWSTLTCEQLGRFQEKFAELIVRECVGIVDDAKRGGSNEIWDNAVKFIKRDLLEHFGVK